MVTMAVRCREGFCFSPRSKLGRPVPPPKQPTFSSRNRMRSHCSVPSRLRHLVLGALERPATVDGPCRIFVMTIPDEVRALDRDLRDVFGSRLTSLVMYGAHDTAHTSHDGPPHSAAAIH